MDYYILKRNGETIYEGHDGRVMENLIPRHRNGKPDVIYDYYTITQSREAVHINCVRKAGRNDVDDSIEAKVWGHVEIPIPDLEKLLAHLHDTE